MIKALLSVRFRALFAGLTKQGRQKKKPSIGTTVLYVILCFYLAVVGCGMMAMLFSSLVHPYHDAGLDWLYFAMAGTFALALSVFGSVFTTQSQLYDAKDNDLLLSMPIPPGAILLSRMVPLVAINLLFGGVVILPAAVVYFLAVQFSLWLLLSQLAALAAVTLLAQAIACLLGWGLHLLLSRVNKSFASVFYMVVFLAIYFGVYSQAGNILTSMAANGETIAGTLQSWAWPLYAMGKGCAGSFLHLALFFAISIAIFGLIYGLLSVTFLHTATTRRSGKRRSLDLGAAKTATAGDAIARKELGKFLGTPVYLTNMGLGLLMMTALAVAGCILRAKLLALLGPTAELVQPHYAALICGILAFTLSMVCISTPSVSLEGKNLWILKSMPVSPRQILLSKLKFHCVLSAPLAGVAGLVLAIAYGCGFADAVLCALIPGTLAVISGILGLLCGLKWARLDWISEAYPCKQSVSVLVVMFSMMGVPLLLGAAYLYAVSWIEPTVFLALAELLLAAVGYGLYRALTVWGVQKWENL